MEFHENFESAHTTAVRACIMESFVKQWNLRVQTRGGEWIVKWVKNLRITTQHIDDICGDAWLTHRLVESLTLKMLKSMCVSAVDIAVLRCEEKKKRELLGHFTTNFHIGGLSFTTQTTQTHNLTLRINYLPVSRLPMGTWRRNTEGSFECSNIQFLFHVCILYSIRFFFGSPSLPSSFLGCLHTTCVMIRYERTSSSSWWEHFLVRRRSSSLLCLALVLLWVWQSRWERQQQTNSQNE